LDYQKPAGSAPTFPPLRLGVMAEDAGAKPGIAMKVVLGTTSKWRRKLFTTHFPECPAEFMAPDIDEKAIRREEPEDLTIAIACAKADALVPRLAGREVLLVCMDQVTVCNGEIREKPVDEAQAREYLASYSQGHGARCVSGMVVHNTRTGRRVTGVDIASVFYRPFPDSKIDEMVKNPEIMDAAGAFIIEDLEDYQDRLEGTMESVEGLPVEPLRSMLLRAAAPVATHVLFDMDGLLLDTETCYTVAQQEILSRFGKTFTWELMAKMMGRKALEAVEIMIDELELRGRISAEEFLAEREKLLDKLFPEAKLMPGVDRLVRHLHKCGVPIAVATSSHRRHFDVKTGRHQELFGLMHHIVTGDMVTKSKPDPEIFQVAAKRFEGGDALDPARVLVFEDAPNGVQAARAAGMQVCHVPDPNLEEASRGGSHGEVRSLEDFKPEEWGLPAF